jgi:hypothetical protein
LLKWENKLNKQAILFNNLKEYLSIIWQYRNNLNMYHSWRGIRYTTLCDQVCRWIATGRWFSHGTPASSTIKSTTIYIVTEILLKVLFCILVEQSSLHFVQVAQYLVFCVVFCRSLYVYLSFFFWSLYCLSFDWRLLIILLYLKTFLCSFDLVRDLASNIDNIYVSQWKNNESVRYYFTS